MKRSSGEKIKIILERGVQEIIERESLEKKLRSGRRLRVKFGIDPTASDLHLGHAVVLRKLRQFQDAGHEASLIIGDFTARIGDPSGQKESRRPLSQGEVLKNLKKYLAQAKKILLAKKTKIFYNSRWFETKSLKPFLELARAGSVQQLLKRADFQKRIEGGKDISLLEIFYPLLQGYDSVMVRADVELGGSDQKFNLLTGRSVLRHFGLPEQDIMMLPLLEGTDGLKKMSKSFGNYIALDERPQEMFGKIMSIPDELITKYALLLTDLEAEGFKPQKPMEAKERLAFEIVKLYHGERAAEKAREFFQKTFREKKLPDKGIETFRFLPGDALVKILVASGAVSSRSEARRLVKSGAVEFRQKTVREVKFIPSGRGVLRVGKKKFLKVVPK